MNKGVKITTSDATPDKTNENIIKEAMEWYEKYRLLTDELQKNPLLDITLISQCSNTFVNSTVLNIIKTIKELQLNH